jgi:hypothetical protein
MRSVALMVLYSSKDYKSDWASEYRAVRIDVHTEDAVASDAHLHCWQVVPFRALATSDIGRSWPRTHRHMPDDE